MQLGRLHAGRACRDADDRGHPGRSGRTATVFFSPSPPAAMPMTWPPHCGRPAAWPWPAAARSASPSTPAATPRCNARPPGRTAPQPERGPPRCRGATAAPCLQPPLRRERAGRWRAGLWPRRRTAGRWRIDRHRGACDQHRCRRLGTAAMKRLPQRGLTLIELITSIAVIGLAGASVLGVLGYLSSSSGSTLARVRAQGIAQSYLSEVLSRPFADPDATPVEASRALFDDIGDYAGRPRRRRRSGRRRHRPVPGPRERYPGRARQRAGHPCAARGRAGGPSRWPDGAGHGLSNAVSVMRRAAGFTLVELVVSITLAAIVLGFAGMLITAPLQHYDLQSRRAELADSAGAALPQLQGDLRGALPNSARVRRNGSFVALEFLAAVDWVRYQGPPGAPFTTSGTFRGIPCPVHRHRPFPQRQQSRHRDTRWRCMDARRLVSAQSAAASISWLPRCPASSASP